MDQKEKNLIDTQFNLDLCAINEINNFTIK